jgi:hypothetical protein
LADRVRWFPGARELVAEARAEMPQKNDLCGAFVTVVSLRANRIPVLDQDEAAVAAGVRLSPDRTPTWPPGEYGRDDYRIALPRADNSDNAGASATGVAQAIETLSKGRLRAVPASGDWGVAALGVLLAGLHGLTWVAPVANVDTAEFGAHDTPEQVLLDYLDGGLPPFRTSRWRVAHFVLLGGTVTGPGGTLVSIVDSYRSLGDEGVHLQLLDRLALALRRDRIASPGGLLLVVRTEEADAATELVTNAGLNASLW